MPPTLILASTSRYRAAQLARLGLPFSTVPPAVTEEALDGEQPSARALRLARAKASAVSRRYPDAWVLGADQVADCSGRIHDKPGDAARCAAQLRASSGRAVHFHSAAVLCRERPAWCRDHVDLTVVRFRVLDEDTIVRYVEREQPFDCAGGFRSEGPGIALFESIDCRDPTALIGLPLIWVAHALRAAGLDPLGDVQS